ncbi:MAG: nitroreductase [Candidatus Marinimicrobia bacterium CG08_land_8_20_14_0_20_45_22]|nr:MAG: nitroreductase [Candidatus Marinimicrobia bacterium CG08_land_8_20_14_0_20_45_22]
MIELIRTRRAIRQFDQTEISLDDLLKCAECAGLAPSGENLQPLKFLLVRDRKLVEAIFPLLQWAGYIQPTGNPKPGKMPTAYFVIAVDQNVTDSSAEKDVGAAIENFILSAWSLGIGTCWIVSIDREKLRQLLQIPERLVIDSIVACGYPDETPVVEVMSDDVRYWKDESGVLHVPKRSLNDILRIDRWLD